MTVFNLSGKGGFEKHLLENESRHNAVIMDIQDVTEMPDYNDPTKTIEKIPIVFDVGGKEISMLATNKITRGSGNFSNSKLFDVIDRAGITDDLMNIFNEGDISNKDSLDFLKGRLIGRTCEVELKTANLKKPESERYSMVSKVIKFTSTEPPAPDKQTSSPAPDATPDASEKVANAEKTKETTETKK